MLQGHPALISAAVALAAVAVPADARADGALACQLAQPGSVDVDGMLDDWQNVAHARAGGRDKDASFDVRCLFDGERLTISLDVRDDLRSRRTRPHKQRLGDDHVIVALAAGGKPLVLTLHPGDDHVAPRRQLGTKKLPAWIAVEDTGQPRGWSMEIELPVARLPGWSSARDSIDATITFADADQLKDVPEPVTTALALGLGDRPALFERFLADARIEAKAVRLDELADLDPAAPGTERVVAGGKVLGLLQDRYHYVELPVARARDVLDVRLVDLRGDGTRQVLTVLRQEGGGGTRDVVMIWGVEGGRFEPALTVEIRKEADGNRIESTWAIEPRAGKGKGKRKPGAQLVVRAGEAVGWDEDTFEEVPAEDAEPIHLPWDDARPGTAYWLDGGTVRSAPVKPARKGSSKRR